MFGLILVLVWFRLGCFSLVCLGLKVDEVDGGVLFFFGFLGELGKAFLYGLG